jgi:type IV pilus assembly protein PilA
MNLKEIEFFEKSKLLGDNGGFTLIELLVVIAVIGILSSIALPSYLNQAAKTRASEAKSILGTINRSQQAYRLENNTFAGVLTNLDAKISGNFYTYSLGAGATTTQATAISTNNLSGLKVSSSLVSQTGDTFNQIICESNDTQLLNTSAAVPSSATTCANANYTRMQ